MEHRTTIETNKARLDIRARGFWIRGQIKKEKKRNYNQRIQQVEQGTFSLLVFSIYGGMARECQAFYS